MILYVFERRAFESNKLNFFQIKKFEKKFGKLLLKKLDKIIRI